MSFNSSSWLLVVGALSLLVGTGKGNNKQIYLGFFFYLLSYVYSISTNSLTICSTSGFTAYLPALIQDDGRGMEVEEEVRRVVEKAEDFDTVRIIDPRAPWVQVTRLPSSKRYEEELQCLNQSYTFAWGCI